jgi:hypothetical protein
MQTCSGTAVIAFERTVIKDGVDHRGFDEDEDLSGECLPTVWNQIEAAIAYSLGHPLLVICEDGLRVEGVLEPHYDWLVQSVPLDESVLHTPERSGVIEDWKRRVERYRDDHLAPDSDIGDKTVAQLLGELRPSQVRATVAGAATTLGTAFTLGVLFG